MRNRRIGSLLMVTILVMFIITNSICIVSADNTPQIKNVIFMIPDGGGFALYDFANAVKEAGGFDDESFQDLSKYSTKITKNSMYLKDYLIGTETTHSLINSVTDSAAAGTALSSGYKTINGYIGVDGKGVPRATILEAAQLAGKRAGIVATYPWAHATPAAFTAHNISRSNVATLSEQIFNQGLDVVLGVGFEANGYYGSKAEAENRGYTIVSNKQDLTDIQPGTKIWGNFYPKDIPFDIYLDENKPTLAEMTEAAINALKGSDKGFFLMVEGSKVDAGGHAKDIVKAVSEYIAFDEAFAVALNFAKERADTVVIVAPDHDTGGLILPDPDGVGGNPDWTQYADAVAEVRQGINSDKISWTSDQHTARRGGVWMYAPEGIEPPRGLATIPGDNSENRSKIIDNTEIAPYLANLMGLDLEAATKELFVDVTDLGTFNPDNKTFTFNDWDISIKENQSVATVKGHTIDLEGKVAVYSNDRFYVPSTLLPRAIDIKNARYKDDLTGRVLVKGQLDKAFAGQEASLILSKQGAQRLTKENIGYIAQTTVNKDGAYVFKFNFYGDISQYELRMYLGDRMVTDSVTVATASYTWLDSDVLLVQKGNVVSSEVIIDNHYDLEGLSYLMTLSFYDNNNKLIKVIKSDNIKPVGNKITIDYLNTEIPQGAATVKAFVWSNLTEMIPLCKSDAITVE